MPGLIEPPSPYTFELTIFYNGSYWEARVELCNGRIRLHHKDRRALVLALNKICIERIMRVVPNEDKEMVLKAYTDYIEKEESEYYRANNNNPTLN